MTFPRYKFRQGPANPHARANGGAAARAMSVVVVSDPEEISRSVGEWDELAAAAIEANPFYESWMLLPAARAFGQEM
jgi:hypothetical protein